MRPLTPIVSGLRREGGLITRRSGRRRSPRASAAGRFIEGREAAPQEILGRPLAEDARGQAPEFRRDLQLVERALGIAGNVEDELLARFPEDVATTSRAGQDWG